MAKIIKRHPFQRDWRRDLFIALLLSLLIAMSMLLYTFGLTSDLLPRLFNAFLGIFILGAGSAFVIVPSVNWLFAWLSGKTSKSTPAPRKSTPKKSQ